MNASGLNEVLTVEEVAAYLRVHDATVRRWCRDGTLRALKIGHTYRIRRADLDEMWRGQGPSTLAEATTEEGARDE